MGMCLPNLLVIQSTKTLLITGVNRAIVTFVTAGKRKVFSLALAYNQKTWMKERRTSNSLCCNDGLSSPTSSLSSFGSCDSLVGATENPEGGKKDLFKERLKLWLPLADSLYDFSPTLHFRRSMSSRAQEKPLLKTVDPKKPLLLETNSSWLCIIFAYHHNTPFISLNHNNMLLGKSSWAWESSAL